MLTYIQNLKMSECNLEIKLEDDSCDIKEPPDAEIIYDNNGTYLKEELDSTKIAEEFSTIDEAYIKIEIENDGENLIWDNNFVKEECDNIQCEEIAITLSHDKETQTRQPHSNLTTCLICGLHHNCISDLLKHKLTVHKYDCIVCKRRFKSKGSLTTHYRRNHPEAIPKVNPPYKCNMCPSYYNKKSSLQQHSAVRQYDCKICKKSFSTKQGITIHNVAKHPKVKRKEKAKQNIKKTIKRSRKVQMKC